MILQSLSPMERTLTLGAAAAIAVVVVALQIDRFAPSDHLAEFPPLAPLALSADRLIVGSPERLALAMDKAGFDLSAVRAGKTKVPALLLEKWPDGFQSIKQAKEKKTLFVQTLLPLILQVNRTISAQRTTLEKLLKAKKSGQVLSHREQAWLDRLAVLYRTKSDKNSVLLVRVAPIPPSLALTQAAIETGWGTSRFARAGNAMFGQWTYDTKKGIRPLKANAGTRHAVKIYDRLVESAWDYARNLNTNPAYKALRLARAAGVKSGHGLAGRLDRYSERGPAYVTLVRNVMAQNNLAGLDKARLAGSAIPKSGRK